MKRENAAPDFRMVRNTRHRKLGGQLGTFDIRPVLLNDRRGQF